MFARSNVCKKQCLQEAMFARSNVCKKQCLQEAMFARSNVCKKQCTSFFSTLKSTNKSVIRKRGVKRELYMLEEFIIVAYLYFLCCFFYVFNIFVIFLSGLRSHQERVV